MGCSLLPCGLTLLGPSSGAAEEGKGLLGWALGLAGGEQAGWPSRPGWAEATSLQGLQHQQLLQHLRLAGLSDFTCQEHLVYHRVNLGKEGRPGKLE